ncbi:MAG TPA: sugar ABC transporter substrate-binding protein [Chloroflexota bacterium]|jgi:multiple sugar transport system substrate-binding protein
MLKRVRHGTAQALLAVGLLGALVMPAAGTTRGARAAAAPPNLAPYQSARINWRQFAGQRLNVAMTDQIDTDALRQHLALFSKLTGITLNFQKYGDVTQQELVNLAGGSGSIDVLQIDSMVIPQWVRLHYLEPLTPYLANSSLTDPRWFNAGDLLPRFAALGVENNLTYALPEYPETSLLFYRKDLFAKAGITAPPTTYAQWAADAAKVTNRAQHLYGIGLIAVKGADQNVYRWASIARAFGGGFFKNFPTDLTPTLNSSANVAATQWMVNVLKQSGPPGEPNMGWNEVDTAAAQGQVASTLDTFDVGPYLEDPSASKTVGKWGAAVVPSGPGGTWPSEFSWMLGINARSSHKGAAWLFVQWADSAPVMLSKLNLTPITNRTSLWNDPKVLSVASKINNGEWLPAVRKSLAIANPQFRPRFPGWEQFGDRLSVAIQEAVAGGQSVQSALDSAQQDVTQQLRIGHYIH